jgi:hypothetical protein
VPYLEVCSSYESWEEFWLELAWSLQIYACIYIYIYIYIHIHIHIHKPNAKLWITKFIDKRGIRNQGRPLKRFLEEWDRNKPWGNKRVGTEFENGKRLKVEWTTYGGYLHRALQHPAGAVRTRSCFHWNQLTRRAASGLEQSATSQASPGRVQRSTQDTDRQYRDEDSFSHKVAKIRRIL